MPAMMVRTEKELTAIKGPAAKAAAVAPERFDSALNAPRTDARSCLVMTLANNAEPETLMKDQPTPRSGWS